MNINAVNPPVLKSAEHTSPSQLARELSSVPRCPVFVPLLSGCSSTTNKRVTAEWMEKRQIRHYQNWILLKKHAIRVTHWIRVTHSESQVTKEQWVNVINNNNNKLFMAPHLVRAPSAYSLILSHTHTLYKYMHYWWWVGRMRRKKTTTADVHLRNYRIKRCCRVTKGKCIHGDPLSVVPTGFVCLTGSLSMTFPIHFKRPDVCSHC